jgi:NADP-dependent 3-hydroxy acid dehydrogenase YdfG
MPDTRTALITGASAGIGWATALALAEAGFDVVVTARRRERLDELVGEVEANGVRALAIAADASDNGEVDRVWRETTAFAGGVPQVVVANAGRGLQGGVLSSDDSAWQSMFQLNVLGTLHLLRIAGEAMKGGEGPRDIVVLGSVVGTNVSPFSSVYGATKFAIESAAEALRREIGQHGVRVTTIKPGIVRSEFQGVAGYGPEVLEGTMEKFGPMLTPEDVAATIRFAVEQPANVNISSLTLRPVRQDYP